MLVSWSVHHQRGAKEPIGEVWIRIQATEGSSCSTRTCKDGLTILGETGRLKKGKQENWMLFWKPFYVLLCFISFLFLFRKKRRILWKHDFGWWSADLKIIFIYSSSLRGEARWQEQPDSFPESKQGWPTRVLLKFNIGKILFFSLASLTKSQDFCAVNPSKGTQFLLVEFFHLWTKVNF